VETYRARAIAERRYFARFPTLPEAINAAALSEVNSKRHPHQRRIPRRALSNSARRLQSVASTLRRARSFEELHDLVDQVVGAVDGIGELYVYDVSTRIGAWLKLEPRQVFVHAGVRVGARALGLTGRDRFELRELPQPFRDLSAAEAEDCLCIFKDDLRALGRVQRPVSG
jgi:hypothetical protein